MRFFITGSTGFIGSHVLDQALARGHKVVALRRSASSLPRIPVRLGAQWSDKALDSLNKDDFRDIDAVIHLAAHTPNVPYDTFENCLYWNVTAALRMARIAHSAGVKRFVIAGTCFEYGTSGERYSAIPITAPLEPTLTYPASKAASWIAFRQFSFETEVSISYQRIFQVFGEGEGAGRLWPSLREAARKGDDFEMTPAEQIRDFIPVEEVAAALLAAAEESNPDRGMITANLGTGNPVTLRDFAASWWKKWGAAGQLKIGAKSYRSGEVMRYVPEINK